MQTSACTCICLFGSLATATWRAESSLPLVDSSLLQVDSPPIRELPPRIKPERTASTKKQVGSPNASGRFGFHGPAALASVRPGPQAVQADRCRFVVPLECFPAIIRCQPAHQCGRVAGFHSSWEGFDQRRLLKWLRVGNSVVLLQSQRPQCCQSGCCQSDAVRSPMYLTTMVGFDPRADPRTRAQESRQRRLAYDPGG